MARSDSLNVGFWIDAGTEVGGGHAARALCLVKELESRGHRCRVASEHAAAVRCATNARLEATRATSDEIARWDCDGWVVDRPHTRPAERATLLELRGRAGVLLCFDANDPSGAVCDLHVSAVACPRPAMSRCRALWGPRYAVIPDLPQGARPPSGDTLLFAFGSADPARLSEAAIPVAAALRGSFEVGLIVGPLVPAARRRALRERADEAGILLLDAPPDGARCFEGVRVAVLPYGQMLHEAIARGVSVAMWHPSAAHAEVGRRFAASCEGWPWVEIGVGAAPQAAAEARVREVAALPQGGVPPVDDRGAKRIVDALEAALRHRVQTFPAVMENPK